MSKLVFISGPYSGPNVESNITRAIEAAVWCAEHRIFYFCPHMNSAYMHTLAPNVPAEFYYDMDIRIAWTCDALLLLPGWQQSNGTLREQEFFVERKYPIFSYPSELDMLLTWYREEKP